MVTPIDGFGPIAAGDLIINGGPISLLVDPLAITNCIIERSILQASTVTPSFTDPKRTILNSGIFQYGDNLTLDGLNFVLVQFAKASDQLQLTFEAWAVAALRNLTNANDPAHASSVNTASISSFAAGLVSAIPGVGFVGSNIPAPSVITCARGTTADPNETSWTCLQRIAATAGWRCFEVANTIYFGGDDFWSSFPSQGTLQEFTPQVQDMDMDFDVGLPLGNITVTCDIGLWTYNPGEVVTVANMGPGTGNWLVNDCQRDLYSPQGTIVLQVPTPPAAVVTPPPTEALL